MRYIRRQLENQVLLAVKGFPAVVLTGPRRAGTAVAGISSSAVTTKQIYEASRSSLLRRSSHVGYEGRKLRGMRRRRITHR
jgi:hypothetical protein